MPPALQCPFRSGQFFAAPESYSVSPSPSAFPQRRRQAFISVRPAGPAPQRSATGCCSRKQPSGESERDLPRIPPGTAITRPLPRFGTSSRRLSEFAKPSAEERPARTGGRTRQPGESRRNIYRISCGDSAIPARFRLPDRNSAKRSCQGNIRGMETAPRPERRPTGRGGLQL